MIKFSNKFWKIAKTCNLYLSFFALGLCVAVTGPTLLDLQHMVNTSTKKIAFIYSSRSIGHLIGCLGGGVIFDMVANKQIILIICNFAMAAGALATPLCKTLEILVVDMAISGISMGAVDTGSNVWCLHLWGKNNGPFFQALHFTFGIGGLVAPIIAAPFLHPFPDTKGIQANLTCTNQTYMMLNSSDNLSNSTFNFVSISRTSITYIYLIIGGFTMIVTVLFIIVYLLAPKDDTKKDKENIENTKQDLLYIIIIVVLTYLFLLMVTGIEIGFSQMLTTYAVKGNLHLTKTTGSYMTSVFWATFMAMRGFSVLLSIKLSHFTLILIELVIGLAAAIILLTLGTHYEWALWFGSGLLGIGIASLFPSVISWLERHIEVTNKIASLFVISGALGEMLIPIFIGSFIEDVPEVLFYIVLSANCLTFVIAILLFVVFKRKGEKYTKEPKEK